MAARPSRLGLAALTLALALPLGPAPAHAGGYDTPILYSARHMGMGGTAIGYVNDPSAIFHNPAGLSKTPGASLLLNASLLLGNITSPPDAKAGEIESDLTVAPLPFLAGSVRPLVGALGVDDFFTLGLAVYPVASAGGSYSYVPGTPGTAGDAVTDSTTLLFLEISPAVAFHLPESLRGPGLHNLSIGIGYRINYVSLDRFKGVEGSDFLTFDFGLTGFSFEGLRVGLQYAPIPELEFGFVFRNKTVTEVTADSGVLVIAEREDVRNEFTLPAKLGVGVAGHLGDLKLALDVEYAFQSQNTRAAISYLADADTGERAGIPNIYEWSDAITLRAGAEYMLTMDDDPDGLWLAPRIGFVFDDITSNPAYPSSFGTPPGPTYTGTAGLGIGMGEWQVNLAYALRYGSATVTEADQANADTCVACSYPGGYEIMLHGVYVDFSYDFEL